MACRVMNIGGAQVIACGRFGFSPCSTPGCRNRSSKLCDYPVTRNGQPGTCDARLCDRCAKNVGPDKDYCSPHARLAERGAK